MKKLYNTPEIEVIQIEAEDICTLSTGDGQSLKTVGWVDLFGPGQDA